MSTLASPDLNHTIITAFKALFEEGNPSLDNYRQQALAHFERLGFPTTKHEEWKYLSLRPLLQLPLQIAQPSREISLEELQDFFIPTISPANRLVFVNGFWREDLSSILDKESIIVNALTESSFLYSSLLQLETNVFESLNAAFRTYFYELKLTNRPSAPIYIHYINDTRRSMILSQPYLRIIGDGNHTVIEKHDTLGQNPHLTNLIQEIFLSSSQDTILHHYRIQNDTSFSSLINTTYVHQFEEAKGFICEYHNYTFTFEGDVIRNNLNILLNRPQAYAAMLGLTMLKGKTLADHHTVADHRAPHATSDELYKGIYDQQSTGVFNGKIFVRQDAQKTNAYQQNRNILLTNQANIYTKPQLEIWADDVKCSHGATTGRLDEEALFYLKSRGIPKATAQTLIIKAFAQEIIDRIELEELKTYLEAIVIQRLGE